MWKKKLRQPQYSFNSEKVFLVATQPGKSVYSYLQTTRLGLTKGEVEQRQSTYGKNEVVHEQRKNPFILFIKTFINPFIGVLTGLAIVSLILDVLMASPGEQEWTGIIIIASMVVFSAFLAGVESKRSHRLFDEDGKEYVFGKTGGGSGRRVGYYRTCSRRHCLSGCRRYGSG